MNNDFALNKNPNLTYINKVKDKNIYYISKVFDLSEFEDFYFDQKLKKVFSVIRSNDREEFTAIYDADSKNYGFRIQKFSKQTGKPYTQSFSFHSGALKKFIDFINSVDSPTLAKISSSRLNENEITEIIEKKHLLNAILESSNSLTHDQLLKLFNNAHKIEKIELLKKFIEEIDSLEAESLHAAIKQKEFKKSLHDLENLLYNADKPDFLSLTRNSENLLKYAANQPKKFSKIG